MLFLGLAVVYALRVCISIAAAPGVTASNKPQGGRSKRYSDDHVL